MAGTSPSPLSSFIAADDYGLRVNCPHVFPFSVSAPQAVVLFWDTSKLLVESGDRGETFKGYNLAGILSKVLGAARSHYHKQSQTIHRAFPLRKTECLAIVN